MKAKVTTAAKKAAVSEWFAAHGQYVVFHTYGELSAYDERDRDKAEKGGMHSDLNTEYRRITKGELSPCGYRRSF